MLLCIVCGFRSLKLAIDTIDAAADFLAKTKRIILVPVLYFFLTVIVVVVWLAAFMNVYCLGEIKPDTAVMPQLKQIDWTNSPYVKPMMVFMLFGLFWITAWINYTSNYICMVSAATYYFNSDAQNEGDAEVGLGFKFAHVNNCGSIAFGSFIIAIIKTIRVIFYYISKKAAAMNPNNKAFQFIIACGNCYLKCIEKVCDYIT